VIVKYDVNIFRVSEVCLSTQGYSNSYRIVCDYQFSAVNICYL